MFFQRVGLHAQAQQSAGQAVEIPVGHRRLRIPGIAPLAVTVVAHMIDLEGIHETVRAVIQGQPQDGHIVGIHDAMAKAGGLPIGQQAGSTDGDGA